MAVTCLLSARGWDWGRNRGRERRGALVNTRFAKYVFFGAKGRGVLENLKRGYVGGLGNSKPFAVPLSTLRVEPARTSVATLQELRSIGAAVSCWRCDTQIGWRRK